jgi:ribulose-5-phosphate 4-epimerase/fuculose-1-phosphate aldolase
MSDCPYRRKFPNLPDLPVFASVEEERLHLKQRLAGSVRIFSTLGFDEGVAGHITARDPEYRDTFWVNPFGVHFSQITVSNLIRVDHTGKVVEGTAPLNTAAFSIHSRIHLMRPDVVAAAHTHSTYGRTFSTLGRKLDTITQDSCQFHNDHVIYDDYGGVVVELDEGTRVAKALGGAKAAILQNHGLLTVGGSVDAAVWWYIAMERCCQVQLLAEAAAGSAGSRPKEMPVASAEQASKLLGCEYAGWWSYQPLYAQILKEQPDFLL